MTPLPRVLVVEHQGDAGLGRLRLPGTRVDVVRPWRGQVVPADVAEAAGPGGLAGLVVLGGEVAAWEDDRAPWLPATRSLLAGAVRSGVPTLGVCLGAQLLALATGGRVERGAAGPEVGFLPVTTAPAAAGDALLGPVVAARGATFRVLQAHGDAVTQLPPDAVLLASSAACPVQAYRVGAAAWGVQYHPEVAPPDWARWLGDLAPALAARGTDAACERSLAARHEGDLAALAGVHDAAFAARVLAPARAVAAVAGAR